MQIYKAYKFRMYPDNKQQEKLNSFLGTKRFIYNYYLGEKIKDNKLNITFILITIFVVYISVYGYKNIILLHYITNDILFYILLSFAILFLVIIPFVAKKKRDDGKKIEMITMKTNWYIIKGTK